MAVRDIKVRLSGVEIEWLALVRGTVQSGEDRAVSDAFVLRECLREMAERNGWKLKEVDDGS